MDAAMRVISGVGLWLSASCAGALAAGPGAGPGVGVALVELKGKVVERPGPLDWLSPGSRHTGRAVREAIRGVAASEELGAVVIRLKDAELGRTQIEELGEAITDVRASGKVVQVYSDGYGTGEILLGSYADEALAQPGGPVVFQGLYMEEMFLADTLAWVGLKADMVQIGDYKGAKEALANSGPSPQWEQNITQLLDSMYAVTRSRLMEGRRMSEEDLDRAMESAWLTDAEGAARAGLVSFAVSLPGLGAHLAARLGGEPEWTGNLLESGDEAMDLANPFALLSKLMSTPDHAPKGPTIAVLHVDGAIVDGESQAGGLLGTEETVGSRTIARATEQIRDEELIHGVIVRIDSPGGSATASEVMWQAIRRLAEVKPVWVSVGSMAASGGYYVAVSGDRVYVNPSSIVGSIGVVGGKIDMSGLYDLARIRVVPRSRGPRSALFSTVGTWSEAERALVRAKMQETYDLFTSRVETGRPGIDLSKTAEGRLFTGQRAVDLGMADVVGGLDRAIADMAEMLDLDEYDVMDYPAPKSLGEFFEETFGDLRGPDGRGAGGAEGALGPLAALASEALGPRAWKQVRRAAAGLLQLREQRVLLMMPGVLLER